MKYTVNMLSKADSVDGQGVGSAYIEQVKLIKEELGDIFDVVINSNKKADIIHVHSVNLDFYFKFKKKNGVRVIYCHFLPETLDGSVKLPELAFNIFKDYVLKFYKKADYVVVVNPIFKKDLVKYGIKEEKIKYIPNFVSKENFYKLDEATNLKTREKYNIPLDKFVVLGVGQVQTRKGVLDFVELAKQNPHLEFVWCGGFSFKGITDGYKELKDVFENSPYKNLKFLGIIPRVEMNMMFNMASCLFMPSYNELFPMSILEAASAEKPIVLRDLELYEDILFDNYLKGKNNDEFNVLLNRLNTDEEFYKDACNKAINISKYYSKEHVASIWKEFYLNIIKEREKEEEEKKH